MRKGIRTAALAGAALVAPAFAQQPTQGPLGGLVDAYRESIRLKMEQQRINTDARTQRAIQDRLDAETEAIRLQTQVGKQPAFSTITFETAVRTVQQRYPDFEQYRVDAARLMDELDPSKGPALNLEHYIEAMYLIAKHASFASKPIAPAANALAAEPEFHQLAMATRIRLLRSVAPEYSTSSDEDLETVLSLIAKRFQDPKATSPKD